MRHGGPRDQWHKRKREKERNIPRLDGEEMFVCCWGGGQPREASTTFAGSLRTEQGKRKDTVDPGYFGAWKKVSRLGFILALYPGTTSLYYSLQHCCCRKRKRREGLFAVSLGRKVELAARRQPKNAFTLTASYQSGRAWCGGRVGLGKNVASTLAAGESDK